MGFTTNRFTRLALSESIYALRARPCLFREFSSRSVFFSKFVLCNPGFHYLFHECSGQWLVQRKADSALGSLELLEFVLKFGNGGPAPRKKTTMVGKSGKPHQRPFVLERGHPIADGFSRLPWHDEILVCILRSCTGSCFFHWRNPGTAFTPTLRCQPLSLWPPRLGSSILAHRLIVRSRESERRRRPFRQARPKCFGQFSSEHAFRSSESFRESSQTTTGA